jgi:hypothetical protein
MGPEGTEEKLDDDPWAEVRWMVDGFNTRRGEEFRLGWGLVVDESMISWTGNSGPGGIPHLSYIKRKPDPLGCELKNACDTSTGMHPLHPPPTRRPSCNVSPLLLLPFTLQVL